MPSAKRCASRSWPGVTKDRRAGSPASCSSITVARRAPPGGGSSRAARCRVTSCSRTPNRSGDFDPKPDPLRPSARWTTASAFHPSNTSYLRVTCRSITPRESQPGRSSSWTKRRAGSLSPQGPPGPGKTGRGARTAAELIRRGQRVGTAATSHKAIHNLLDEITNAAREEALRFRGLKKSSAQNAETEYRSASITSKAELADVIADAPRVNLLAGTAWLFAHHDFDGAGLIDTLIIDEAGPGALARPPAPGTAAPDGGPLGGPPPRPPGPP